MFTHELVTHKIISKQCFDEPIDEFIVKIDVIMCKKKTISIVYLALGLRLIFEHRP